MAHPIPERPSQDWSAGFVVGHDMAKANLLLQIELMAMERPNWSEALLWAHDQIQNGATGDHLRRS